MAPVAAGTARLGSGWPGSCWGLRLCVWWRRRRSCSARRGSGHDARDARHLARLLHLGEVVAVAVPSVEQEAARDLVRAREDCRGDLMAVRHRLSKLLLRQGIVYYGGKAWSGRHEAWLRTHRSDTPGPAAGL